MKSQALRVVALLLAATAWCAAQSASNPERITNGPIVESVSDHWAVVAWSTNAGGSSVVKYGTNPGQLNQTAQSGYANTGDVHRVKVENLQPNTTYYFQIVSAQGQGTGAQAVSPVKQFTTQGNATAADKVPLYRSMVGNGEMLSTDDDAARAAGAGRQDLAGYVQRSQGPNTVPLYDFYNPANGDHIYTTNPSEAQSAAPNAQLQNKGVVGYAAASQADGAVPLYRLLNPRTGTHVYSGVAGEIANLHQRGFQTQGVAAYIWPH